MNFYRAILFTLATFLSTVGCVENTEDKIATIEIKGTNPVRLNRLDPLTFNPLPSITDSINGKNIVDHDLPKFYNLVLGQDFYSVYLENGHDLTIETEGNEVNFSGKGAVFNNKLVKWHKLKNSYNSRKPFFALDYDEFKSRLDSLRRDFNVIKNDVAHSKQRKLIEDVFTAYTQIMKLNYLLVNYNLSDQTVEIPTLLNEAIDLQPSLSYLADLELPDYFISLHLYYDAYLGPQVRKEEFNGHDSLKNQYYELLYNKIDELVEKKTLQEFLKAKTVMLEMQSQGLNNLFVSLNQQFQSEFPSSAYSNFIHDFQVQLSDIENQAFPDIPLADIQGNEVRLSDFKGKLIYLDIWATWCAPCIKEFPNSKKLHQRLLGENVLFVYLSVDSDKEKWKTFIDKNLDLEGIHLIEKDISVRESLKFDGIPRYMLIDEQGNIINAQAPRPSSEKIEEVIRGLL